nr:hypothetical protein [Natronorubrum halophilum]
MTDGEGSNRMMAVCASCGSAYAAREQSEGEFVPIGNRNGCECGGTEFTKVETETDLEFDEGG